MAAASIPICNLPRNLRVLLDEFLTDFALVAYEAGRRAERAEVAGRLLGTMGAPSITAIKSAVADKFGVELAEMSSSRTRRQDAHARQVAMYLAHQTTPHSLAAIGRHFGDRDHTTVAFAIKAVRRRCQTDPALMALVEELRAALGAAA